jgi:spore maturation protein CgeB
MAANNSSFDVRVLLARPGPAFSVADVARGWAKGLQACGVTVADFNYDERLDFYCKAHIDKDGDGTYTKSVTDDEALHMAAQGLLAACYTFQPDIIFVVSGFYIPVEFYDLFHARGHKIALLCTESPYEDDAQFDRAHYVDWVMLNDPTNLELFRQHNLNTHYVPHAYDPDVHRPGPSDPDAASDFCFVGTAYESRIAFLEAVNWSGIDVAMGGNWSWLKDDSPLDKFIAHDKRWCVDNTETVKLYRSSKASVNIYRKEAQRPELVDGWAMGPREVELAAVGLFYLAEPRGENREVLPMIPTFTDPHDFGDKLRWWLDRDHGRQAIADDARQAIAGRTFEAHAAEFLRRVS